MSVNSLLLYFFILFSCTITINGVAQQQDPVSESNDPIRESIAQEEQNQKLIGMKLTKDDFDYLVKINEKYKISEEEKLLRNGNRDTMSIKQKIKIARSYRKEYVLNKKEEKFRKKKFESIQAKENLKHMQELEKKAKARDRRRKWEARKRKFLNLFK
jgi:hypothetical protein